MTKKTTRTRAEAKRLMWEYYRENRLTIPKGIRAKREIVIHLIQDGASPSIAFSNAQDV